VPNALLNWVGEKLQVSTDAALARMLGVSPESICAMRRRRIPIGSTLLISMHDLLGVPIRELRMRMGVVGESMSNAENKGKIVASAAVEELRITPAEMRAIRLFRSVPEVSRPKFFELMNTVCRACHWSDAAPSPVAIISIDRRRA
jgi:hypothetical protein